MFVDPVQPFEPSTPLNTAVLFLVFNRPDVTAQVFEAIRQARPPRLYVEADGPRSNRPGETAKCDAVREIISHVDWPCELKTLFRTDNLGCKYAVSSAINWFFETRRWVLSLKMIVCRVRAFFGFVKNCLFISKKILGSCKSATSVFC